MTSDWSHRLTRDQVPEEGLHVDLVADENTRAALAKIASLRELPRLAASFDVIRSGSDGLHVVGEITAIVGQECIVTLEFIENNIVEAIDLTFVPGGSGAPENTIAEASLTGEEMDPPEPLSGGAVDLGAIATEYFLLGIDPYPRKPGAVFENPGAGDTATDSPFAALTALKKPRPGGGS